MTISNLKSLVTEQGNHAIPLVIDDVGDEPNEENREDAVRRLIEESPEQRLTIPDIGEKLGIGYPAAANLILHSKSSMLHKGMIRFDRKAPKPRYVTIDPGFTEDGNIDFYLTELRSCDPKVQDIPVMRRIAEALMVYTQKGVWAKNGGKRLRANHLLKAFRNHGVLGAIKRVVQGPITPGFNILIELGRWDLTFEQIVIDFSDVFDDEAVQLAAVARLKLLKDKA
ncbi:hypothetical protein MBTS_09335 [Methylobacterium bullatum]|nr:hypothetical protein [Methylobacterium bullatum]